MKISAILAAALVALGSTVYAADNDRDHDRDRTYDKPRAEQRQDHRTAQDHRTMGQKLRDSMHRLGDKTRSAFHRADDKVDRTADRARDRDDTRTMGGPGMSDNERARRDRMDNAYDNWRNQRKDSR